MATTRAAVPTIGELIDQYLSDCERGANGHHKLARKTVKFSYRFPLKGGDQPHKDYPHSFVSWSTREGITSPKQLTQAVVDRFAEYHKNRTADDGEPLSDKTVATYVTCVQYWLNWLARKNVIGSVQGRPSRRNPSGKIAAYQATVETPAPKLPKVLEREEIDRIERAADNDRDKLIVRILADTGVRVGELCSLRLGDVHESRVPFGRFLRVRGKTGERDVPVDPKLWQRIRDYIARSRSENTESDHLFLGRRRKESGKFEPLTETGVTQLVKLLGEQAGVPRAHSHLFRHSYATWCCQRGMDSITLAKILGHSSLTMIQKVYAHIAPADTYAAMVKYLSD